MVNNSVGALHVALAAAVVGWLVFCASHSFAVWKKRNAGEDARSSHSLLILGLVLCAAALAAGWLNREITRRAGVILGTDFFVVRAHAKTTPHLVQGGGSVDDGAMLATFEDPEAEREEAQLRGEIAVLSEQIASVRLRPLVLDSELVRLSQDAGDSQRARLSQLGYGVLHPSQAGAIPALALKEGELVAAQQAKNNAAETQFERTSALVQAGIIARDKLDAAAAAAKTAAQELRERQDLIQEAKAGSNVVARTEGAVRLDGQRARAERSAELAVLEAKLSEFRMSLQQLHQQQSVMAPFAGTVVYRHPSPALAGEGKVILALSKGPGFLATVQLPAREAAMLVPGRSLRMKLKRALVSEEVTGKLKSVQIVPGYPDRRNLQIECNLPSEQFAAFTTGAIPVTLQWQPPIYTEPITQAGLVFSFLPMMAWLFKLVRRKGAQGAPSDVDAFDGKWPAAWAYSAEEEDLHQLGIKLGEDLRNQAPSSVVLKKVERALEKEPAMSAHLVKTGFFKAMRQSKPANSPAPSANPMRAEVDQVLARLGLSAQDLQAVAR